MRRTRLCELLDIQLPILGAPMGPEIASLELAAAVSNAGGLGMISFGAYPPARLKERIKRLRSLTSHPFGVNVLLQGPRLPLPEAAFVDVCIEERIPVLSFFWGDPTPYVEKAHKAGIKVCDQVGSVSAAKEHNKLERISRTIVPTVPATCPPASTPCAIMKSTPACCARFAALTEPT